MEALLKEARRRLLQGRSLAFAAVAERTGAAPRGPGALLLAEPDAPALGTVGGGLLEAQARELALSMLAAGGGRAVSFCLEHDGLAEHGRRGADVTLWLQALPAVDAALTAALDAALVRLTEGKPGGLLWPAAGPPVLTDRVPAGTAELTEDADGAPAFLLGLRRPCRVLLYGAGHVAVETAVLLSHLGFTCVVVDDRPDFARPERFPGAAEVRCRDLACLGPEDLPGAADCVLLMSQPRPGPHPPPGHPAGGARLPGRPGQPEEGGLPPRRPDGGGLLPGRPGPDHPAGGPPPGGRDPGGDRPERGRPAGVAAGGGRPVPSVEKI